MHVLFDFEDNSQVFVQTWSFKLEAVVYIGCRSDPSLFPPQVSSPYGPGSVPVGAPLSGFAMFQHQIKAVHESAHMEDNQRQESSEAERRQRFTTRSPTILDRDGKCLHGHFEQYFWGRGYT